MASVTSASVVLAILDPETYEPDLRVWDIDTRTLTPESLPTGVLLNFVVEASCYSAIPDRECLIECLTSSGEGLYASALKFGRLGGSSHIADHTVDTLEIKEPGHYEVFLKTRSGTAICSTSFTVADPALGDLG